MGSIYIRQIHQFSMDILEGNIYIFNDFEVWRAEWKVWRGERYKISGLNENSTITPASKESVLINKEKFRFRDYDQLMKIADNNLSYDGN